MKTCFPDLNVWLALSDRSHQHNCRAWNWLTSVSPHSSSIMCRYTQIGLVRLLTTAAVMGPAVLTLREAWAVYDQWLADPRVEFHPEPRGVEAGFRAIIAPFAGKSAPKVVGDCYLLAHAQQCNATLVTFDRALHSLAMKYSQGAV